MKSAEDIVNSYNNGCKKIEERDFRNALGYFSEVLYTVGYVQEEVKIKAYLNRGIAYYCIGSPSSAIDDWREVIKFASSYPEIKETARNLIETVNQERREQDINIEGELYE